MNGHGAWPPPQPSGTRRRHRHSEGRPPDRSHIPDHHQTRLAGGVPPQSRDRGQPSSTHHRRTPTRPEESSPSRAGAGTSSAAASWGSAPPGGRSELRGWDQSWTGGASPPSSSAAFDGSAQRSRRNPLRALAAAFLALFRTKSRLKHGERRGVTAGGRQAAAVSPIPASAAADNWSRRSSTTDSTRASPLHRRLTTRPVVSPVPEEAPAADRSPRLHPTDSTRGLQHRRRRMTPSVASPMRSEAASETSGSERSYNTRDSIRGSRYQGLSAGTKLTIDDILYATNNFSSACRIGHGEFGSVYKGVLQDGKVVAIKRARKGSDDHMDPEFQSEITILPHLTHLNLVRMLCYVEGRGERVIVVEYVPNGTLREHLDGTQGTTLDFRARLSIAEDIAHAVTYLHGYADHPIIHRDIKASNVLLTQTLRAKVGDFGFARLGPPEGSYVVTKIKGTTGYLDPEYLKTQQLSDKSDVYAFGVLLVELLSGRRPIERRRRLVERVTADWAMEKFPCGQAYEVLDPKIPNSPAVNLALERMLELASQCLAQTKHARPSMKDCGKILMGIRNDYIEGSRHNVPQPELFER